MAINATWHKNNRMPKNASVEQRIQWHVKHQENCDCRPIPPSIKKLMGKK